MKPRRDYRECSDRFMLYISIDIVVWQDAAYILRAARCAGDSVSHHIGLDATTMNHCIPRRLWFFVTSNPRSACITPAWIALMSDASVFRVVASHPTARSELPSGVIPRHLSRVDPRILPLIPMPSLVLRRPSHTPCRSLFRRCADESVMS